jgi:hypothetical protein
MQPSYFSVSVVIAPKWKGETDQGETDQPELRGFSAAQG